MWGDSLTGLMIPKELESILSGCVWQGTSGKYWDVSQQSGWGGPTLSVGR